MTFWKCKLSDCTHQGCVQNENVCAWDTVPPLPQPLIGRPWTQKYLCFNLGHRTFHDSCFCDISSGLGKANWCSSARTRSYPNSSYPLFKVLAMGSHKKSMTAEPKAASLHFTCMSCNLHSWKTETRMDATGARLCWTEWKSSNQSSFSSFLLPLFLFFPPSLLKSSCLYPSQDLKAVCLLFLWKSWGWNINILTNIEKDCDYYNFMFLIWCTYYYFF